MTLRPCSLVLTAPPARVALVPEGRVHVARNGVVTGGWRAPALADAVQAVALPDGRFVILD